MKKKLLELYYFFNLSKEETNINQKKIRDFEWDSIKEFIVPGMFLDVGCGAGYSMLKAKKEFNCTTFGIDPNPLEHGVGRLESNYSVNVENIIFGEAENIPFPDKQFDTVYSSHVLEHVTDQKKSLQEMKRVLKPDGILIIGMPSASMAVINLFTQILFTTHTKIVNLLFSRIINTGKVKWWEIFIPVSHSYENKTVISDIFDYRTSAWKKTIEEEFKIVKIIKPALYPYPEYKQLFKFITNSKFSSSIFFVCKT